TKLYTLSLHDALPISGHQRTSWSVLKSFAVSSVTTDRLREAGRGSPSRPSAPPPAQTRPRGASDRPPRVQPASSCHHLDCLRQRSEEHTSELQSLAYL